MVVASVSSPAGSAFTVEPLRGAQEAVVRAVAWPARARDAAAPLSSDTVRDVIAGPVRTCIPSQGSSDALTARFHMQRDSGPAAGESLGSVDKQHNPRDAVGRLSRAGRHSQR